MSTLIKDKNLIFAEIKKIIDDESFFTLYEDDFLDEDKIIGFLKINLENEWEAMDYDFDEDEINLTDGIYIHLVGDRKKSIKIIDQVTLKIRKTFNKEMKIDYGFAGNKFNSNFNLKIFLLKRQDISKNIGFHSTTIVS